MILHWDLREAMDVEIVQQAAHELYLEARPRYITDNGKQFTGSEFQRFIALHGMTHVTTSPYYPQSNGKLERFHGTIKSECIRRKALTDQGHAKSVIAPYSNYYNHERLHSAIGYVTPADRLAGRDKAIQDERDRKLMQAQKMRKDLDEKKRTNVENAT